VVRNLKITESSVFIFSKLFVWHSSGENVRMKESNYFLSFWRLLLSFILTFSPNECQTKSFEKINTQLSAISKKVLLTSNLTLHEIAILQKKDAWGD